MDESELQRAVYRYYEAMQDASQCPAMLLSDGCDPEPARLMWELEKARVDMFEAAGIDVEKDKNFIKQIEED